MQWLLQREERSKSLCQRAGGCWRQKHRCNLHRNRSRIFSCWSWCVSQGQAMLLILPVISERFISWCLCWRNGFRIPGLTLSMNVSGAVPGVKSFSCSQPRQAHHLWGSQGSINEKKYGHHHVIPLLFLWVTKAFISLCFRYDFHKAEKCSAISQLLATFQTLPSTICT